MAEDIVIPFSSPNAAPSEAPQTDRIPPGSYAIQVMQAEQATSKRGSQMVVVDYHVAAGDYKGKRLRDYFTIPRPNSDDTFVGVARLNSLVRAVRGEPATKNAKSGGVLKLLLSKQCIVDVDDDQSQDGRHTNSKIVAYFFPKSDAGKQRIEMMRNGASALAPATGMATATATASPVDDLDTGDDDLAEGPTATEEAAAVATDDLEDLFGD